MAQLNYIGQGAALGLTVTQKTPNLRLEFGSAGHAGGMSQKVHAHKHGSCNGLSKIDWADVASWCKAHKPRGRSPLEWLRLASVAGFAHLDVDVAEAIELRARSACTQPCRRKRRGMDLRF